jgi:hypothetical protein
MDADDYFSEDYQRARAKFLAACRRTRLLPQAYRASAENGERSLPLADSVRLGDPAARHMLIICGGDRPADALCCSAIEIGWIYDIASASLPEDSAVLLVHHGPVPPASTENPLPAGSPPEWESDLLTKVEQRYAEYAREKGIDSLGRPLARPEPHTTSGYPVSMLDALAKWLNSTADGRIAIIDIRIGLGPYGEAEIAPCHPADSLAAARVRTWFGLADSADANTAASQQPDSLAAGLIGRLPEAEVTVFTASFGTYSMMSVLEALAIRPKGNSLPDPRELLFPTDAAWRTAVWRNAVSVLQLALAGLRAR